MKRINKVVVIVLLFMSCNSNSDTKSKEINTDGGVGLSLSSNEEEPQLNISILWDLSDRINPSVNVSSPPQHEKDISIIKIVSGIFKNDMRKRGAYRAKGRMKVFFTPAPFNEQVNSIASNLNIDLSTFKGEGANKKKKEVYDSIETTFVRYATDIFRLTMESNKNKKQWDGSDIWRFFKNDVKEYCVEGSGNYRNILIILTDGYIYHKDSKERRGNRTCYLLPEIFKPFRNNVNWQSDFLKGNYGLISTRKDLQSLEVLVLEISPSKEYKNDEDFIKHYLGKWFEEMGISKTNYACFNTDLPAYTKNKIESFLRID